MCICITPKYVYMDIISCCLTTFTTRTIITRMVLRLETVYKPNLVRNVYPHLFAFVNLDTCRVETKNTKTYYFYY